MIELDDSSGVGGSPQSLLDLMVGSYTGTIEWRDEGLAQYQGDLGPTPLDIEIRYEGGEARTVNEMFVGECNFPPCFCADSTQVDVVIDVVSEDGVLAESFNGVLTKDEAEISSALGGTFIRIEFQQDQAAGSLSSASFLLTDLAEGGALDSLSLYVEPSEDGLTGSIGARLILVDDDERSDTLASFEVARE